MPISARRQSTPNVQKFVKQPFSDEQENYLGESRYGNDKISEETKNLLTTQFSQLKLTIDKFRLISVLGRGHFGKVNHI